MNEQRVHRWFQVGVLLKGAHAVIECVTGLAFALVSTETIAGLARALTQHELVENPKDFFAGHLLALAQNLSIETKHFYAFYLLSHGLVKLGLIVALLKNKLWAYPASLIVLGLFIVYQLYRFSHTHSMGLIVITGFDIVVIGLIWQEYSLVRRHRR